jgi:hypothetical protein
MPLYSILFRDGPCRGESRTNRYDLPPDTLACGGRDYHLDLHNSEGSILVYVLAGGPHDDTTPEQVRGRRDVFQAFRRVMHIATHSVGGELRRVQRSRQRIRRAVR